MNKVDPDLARKSKERKILKRLKRDIARARRIATERIKPEAFFCSVCQAPPSEPCRTPNGRSLSGVHRSHKPRRDAAEFQTKRILEAGREAEKRLASEKA